MLREGDAAGDELADATLLAFFVLEGAVFKPAFDVEGIAPFYVGTGRLDQTVPADDGVEHTMPSAIQRGENRHKFHDRFRSGRRGQSRRVGQRYCVTLYQGSVNAAQVRIAEVFKEAIRANAPAIAIAHNHPSGDPTPSAADISLTAELNKAAKLLDIDLIDHLIVGDGRWISLRRLGLGFPTGK